MKPYAMAVSLLFALSTYAAEPSQNRFLIPVAYTSMAVAQASFSGGMMIATGLQDLPVIEVRILYADMVVIPPSPAHAQEFPMRRATRAWDFFTSKNGRAKGLVTSTENTIIVWWIE